MAMHPARCPAVQGKATYSLRIYQRVKAAGFKEGPNLCARSHPARCAVNSTLGHVRAAATDYNSFV